MGTAISIANNQQRAIQHDESLRFFLDDKIYRRGSGRRRSSGQSLDQRMDLVDLDMNADFELPDLVEQHILTMQEIARAACLGSTTKEK